MAKNQRLDEKMEHIRHQIEALEQKKTTGKHEVQGKIGASLLSVDKEIKFQLWRLKLFETLKKESIKTINEKLSELDRDKMESIQEIVVYESMQLAVGKYMGVT